MSKDDDRLHELAVELQSDSFFSRVIKKIEELKGQPLTELERRKFMSDLRNNTSVEIREVEPKPN